MRKAILIVLLFFSVIMKAQNPVSFPKDTIISKPELNFEVLWHTFQDNYAFFTLRKIDWKKMYDQYRPKVNASTSDDELYKVFSSMLAPFEDNHINVIIPHVKQFKSLKPSQFTREFPSDSLKNAFWNMVGKTLSDNGFGKLETAGVEFQGKPLFVYAVSKDYAYLRFNRCFVDPNADSKPDATVAGQLLDSILDKFKDSKGLIIDVRDNMGGNDEFAFEVAARFSKDRLLAMYKKTRIRGGGYEDFGTTEKWFIEPAAKTFLKPVVVLTNDRTVSAGDVFAMIMREIPNVKIVGSNTRGIYSDMYGFTLPNKWLISLSNQRYYNNRMTCYEGTGTPVTIEVFNTRTDLTGMSDPVLMAAFSALH